MNKYQIDQTVYFITSNSGHIKVQPMKIYRMAYLVKFNYIEYDGHCLENPDDSFEVPEDKLYASKQDAIQEIDRQLTDLRVHDATC